MTETPSDVANQLFGIEYQDLNPPQVQVSEPVHHVERSSNWILYFMIIVGASTIGSIGLPDSDTLPPSPLTLVTQLTENSPLKSPTRSPRKSPTKSCSMSPKAPREF